MYILDKYKPNTQKSLFHKDIIGHIRKWIVNLDLLIENNKDVKNVLLIYGPSGCGKTTTIEVLFKAYNLITYDANEIKSNKKLEEIFTNLLNVNSKTLENIDKWNHKNKKEKNNIIYIDNIEGSDLNFIDIINYIHIKKNTNIPIIISCNIHSIKNFENDLKLHNNITCLKINSPSLLELSKLGNDINTNENLNLNKTNIKQIIELSKYDIRQFLFILNQWSLLKTDFNDFINTIQLKNKDIDLVTKLFHIFNHKNKFSIEDLYITCHSEPITISNNIYQNYLNNISDKKVYDIDQLDTLDLISSISENFSESDFIQKRIFDDQQWDLYNEYTISSCVLPSNKLKDFFNKKKYADVINSYDINSNNFMYYPYKDISFNYYNSLQEVKKKCIENYTNSYINNALKSNEILYNYKLIHNLSIEKSFYITIILNYKLNILTSYFENNKKGKNISKKEKLDLYNNIKNNTTINSTILDSLKYISSFILIYRLFTINTEDVFINVSKKSDNYVHDCVDKIEIKLFKRFLNIFSINENNHTLKAHVEIAIKYEILSELLKTFDTNEKQEKSFIDRNIDNLTLDLSQIWKL